MIVEIDNCFRYSNRRSFDCAKLHRFKSGQPKHELLLQPDEIDGEEGLSVSGTMNYHKMGA
jgi:hypothetical protein